MTTAQSKALNDRELVALALSGDASALATLLARHRPAIARHVQRYPLDAADRQDLVQDVMLQVVRKLHLFRGDSQLSTWLYRITANTALMRMRSDRRRREDSLDESSVEEDVSLPAPPGGEWAQRADARLEQAELQKQLQRAVAALPHHYQEVVREHYVEGRSLDSAAAALSTTESAVRSRLHRAREALRRMLIEQSIGQIDAA